MRFLSISNVQHILRSATGDCPSDCIIEYFKRLNLPFASFWRKFSFQLCSYFADGRILDGDALKKRNGHLGFGGRLGIMNLLNLFAATLGSLAISKWFEVDIVTFHNDDENGGN